MKKENFFLILLFLILLSFTFFRYIKIIKDTNGIFLFPVDDSYITLSYSLQMAKGFPFKFNEDEPAIPMEPSFFAQFFYSFIYKFGIRNIEEFSSVIFWINVIFLLITIFLIFHIFKICTNDNFLSFVAVFMLSLFVPFRYIFYLGMGHSFLTLFFYLNMIFFLLKKEVPFFISGIFLAISRPETIFIILIFLIYFFIKKERKFLFYTIPLIFIWAIPSIIYFFISKTLLPTGIHTQSIFFFYSFPAIFSLLTEYFRDYFIGIFLGFYPSLWESGNIEFYSSQLPFGLFIFFLIGFFNKKTFSNEKSKEFIKISLINFLVFWFISSLTVFRGVQLLRHTVWLFPFIFLISIFGIDFLVKKIKFPYIKQIVYGFYFLILLFQSIDFENKNIFITVYKNYPHYVASKWIKENIKDGDILSITGARLKFFSQKKIVPFSVSLNWRMYRFSKEFHPSNYFELLKYHFKEDGKYYVYFSLDDEEIPWFNSFTFLADTIVYYQRQVTGNYVKIGRVNVNKIFDAQKNYIEGSYEIIDYLDIGDPISEKTHKYSYMHEPLIKIRFFPIVGKIGDKEFVEGGIFSRGERFNFYIKGEIKDNVYLICRMAKNINFSMTIYKNISPGFLELPFQQIQVYLNGNYIGLFNLKDVENFKEFIINLPKKFLKQGKNELFITLPHISVSYWIVRKLD
jgi:hypothetical protein